MNERFDTALQLWVDENGNPVDEDGNVITPEA